MVCIFEDKEDSLLSEFVRASISDQIICLYSDGAASLKETLLSAHSKYPDEFIVVYCDLVPNNWFSRSVFVSLWDCVGGESDLHGKVFIAPSLSTEYYYLKSLYKYGLVKPEYKKLVETCMSRKPYLDNSNLNKWDHKEYSTHKRLCKLLCKRAVNSCASTISKEQCYYILGDCLCSEGSDSECVEASVYDKSCRVAEEWCFRVNGWDVVLLIVISKVQLNAL